MKKKTMEEIKNAEARKYNATEFGSKIDFKAGFDCRDKLDNEALKIAVKVLRDICDYEDYEDSTFKIARYALHEIIKLGVVE